MAEVRLPSPVKAFEVEDIDSLDAGPGAIEYMGTGLWYECPCGCRATGFLEFRAGSNHPSWVFDGNQATPTLTPSINHVGHWHGYLRNGYWINS